VSGGERWASEEAPDPIRSEQIAEYVHEAGYADDIPLTVGVSQPSGGDVYFENEVPGLGADDIAYGASLAKQITGSCAALLERDGVLDPAAPIDRWLPELPPWSHHVRVRHLIHHTAALPGPWPRMEAAGASDWTTHGVLAALAATPSLDREPGVAYEYSNAGYICLALIVARLSGTSLDTFARKRLFGPAGMGNSRFWTGPDPAPPNASLTPKPLRPAPLSVGDGGLWTSVSDLLRWNAAMIDDAFGVANRVHTAGSLDDGPPLDYAYGVRVYEEAGHRVHSHGGSYGSTTSKLMRFPDSHSSFAVLAADDSVQRMVGLSEALRQALLI
jgi:CubicO group peptidase (beta-lactamase class C family)